MRFAINNLIFLWLSSTWRGSKRSLGVKTHIHGKFEKISVHWWKKIPAPPPILNIFNPFLKKFNFYRGFPVFPNFTINKKWVKFFSGNRLKKSSGHFFFNSILFSFSLWILHFDIKDILVKWKINWMGPFLRILLRIQNSQKRIVGTFCSLYESFII